MVPSRRGNVIDPAYAASGQCANDCSIGPWQDQPRHGVQRTPAPDGSEQIQQCLLAFANNADIHRALQERDLGQGTHVFAPKDQRCVGPGRLQVLEQLPCGGPCATEHQADGDNVSIGRKARHDFFVSQSVKMVWAERKVVPEALADRVDDVDMVSGRLETAAQVGEADRRNRDRRYRIRGGDELRRVDQRHLHDETVPFPWGIGSIVRTVVGQRKG